MKNLGMAAFLALLLFSSCDLFSPDLIFNAGEEISFENGLPETELKYLFDNDERLTLSTDGTFFYEQLDVEYAGEDWDFDGTNAEGLVYRTGSLRGTFRYDRETMILTMTNQQEYVNNGGTGEWSNINITNDFYIFQTTSVFLEHQFYGTPFRVGTVFAKQENGSFLQTSFQADLYTRYQVSTNYVFDEDEGSFDKLTEILNYDTNESGVVVQTGGIRYATEGEFAVSSADGFSRNQSGVLGFVWDCYYESDYSTNNGWSTYFYQSDHDDDSEEFVHMGDYFLFRPQNEMMRNGEEKE